MEHLGGGYKRREGVIYFAGARVREADGGSFRYLGGSWARDEANVYSAGVRLRAADTESFAVLSNVFASDSAHVYYLGGKVAKANAASFEALDSGCHFAAPGKYPVSYAGYGRDDANVFHYTFTIGAPSIVRKAEPASFVSLEGTFGHDQQGVFVDRRLIRGADRPTWFRLQGLYSRDARTVFYDDRLIQGADLESFICLWSAHGTWAKDAHSYYNVGRSATQDEYLAELASEAARYERIKDNLLAGKL